MCGKALSARKGEKRRTIAQQRPVQPRQQQMPRPDPLTCNTSAVTEPGPLSPAQRILEHRAECLSPDYWPGASEVHDCVYWCLNTAYGAPDPCARNFVR